jgi:hypothetical protein
MEVSWGRSVQLTASSTWLNILYHVVAMFFQANWIKKKKKKKNGMTSPHLTLKGTSCH